MARTISNTESGARAEAFVVEHVRCPYCGKALVRLPPASPVYDVACQRCEFRAQVKSVETPPRARIRGASARPLAGLRLAGKLSPPVIVIWGWNGVKRTAHSVALFPLISLARADPAAPLDRSSGATGKARWGSPHNRQLWRDAATQVYR